MARKLVCALVFVGLCSFDAHAARHGGLRAQWAARRAACVAKWAETHSTPQAAWNAYYRAMIEQDWDAAYRSLCRESRKHAVAGAAFAVLWFSGEDGHGGAAENLARRHRVCIEAMIREIRAFNAGQESRLSGSDETANSFDDRESQALIETQVILLRHIPNHAAFYRDAMNALLAFTEDDTPEAAKDSGNCGDQSPSLTQIRFKGNRAQALYRTDAALIRGSEVPGERTIDFTFEDGGWKVRELAW